MYKINFKVFFIILVFISSLNAQSKKEKLILNSYISINDKEFINIDDLKEEDYYKKNLKIVYKIVLDTNSLANKKYFFRLHCDKKNFISSNFPYSFNNNMFLFEVNNKSPNNFFLELNFKENYPFFNLEILNEMEIKYFANFEKVLFGIAYGIIICAFLYNFIFFLYNKDKAFLYYSLFQFFLLSFLLVISLPYFTLEATFKYEEYLILAIVVLNNLIVILAILFNTKFLNTKKYLPYFHKFLLFLLGLVSLDFIFIFVFNTSFVYDYIPTYSIIFILLVSAFMVLKKGFKPALFYIIGWITLFLFVFFAETEFSSLGEIYLLHIGLPLESLIFSFALAYKVKQIELEKQKSEQLLIHQNKLASMGEMIANIAHQWRQPLTHLGYIFMNINSTFRHNKLDKQYLDKKTKEANIQLEYMSNTIDDFKDFYTPKSNKNTFYIKECIDSSLNIIYAELLKNSIEVEVFGEDFKIQGYKSELSQVILNLLSNSKDALIKDNIKNPKIEIILQENEISVCDNGNGIDNKIKQKIFEPFFTTKEKGTGIGLYMSKVILERDFNAKLYYQNKANGSCFYIRL